MLRDERFYSNRYSDPVERLIWEPMLRKTTTLYPLARRDPIFTPLFTAVLGSGGFAIGTATITYASIASAIAVTALTVGLQAILTPHPKPPTPEDGKVPMTQPLPFRIWGVGRVRNAGAYMLWESSANKLFAVQALFAHRIKSVNRFFLHEDEVTLASDSWVNAVPGGGGRYGRRVKIDYRIGNTPELPYADPVATFGSTGLWTSNHRGDGQASVFMMAKAPSAKDYQAVFPFGAPRLSVESDAAFVWDFRDPAQDPENQLTWAWSRNSALVCAWHLCFNEFGYLRDYRKAILPVLDLWIEEANICDEDVPLAGGGTEKRYQCNGFDTSENGPKSGMNSILATCDGHLVARGDGARILTVGKFRESRCTTLTDADITGHQIQYDVLFDEEVNRLVPKFTYPETNYTTADTDFFEDTSRQLTSGRVLSQDGTYQWCHQWRQARRLGKRDWLRIQEKVKGTLDIQLSGINAVYSRWVRLDTPLRLPRLNGKIVENRRSVIALLKSGFSMDFVQNPTDIDAWNPATDEGQQPPVPPAPNLANVITPVISLVQAKQSSGSVYIRVVIVDPDDESLTPIVRYRVANADGVGTPGAWIEQQFSGAVPSGGTVDLATNTVPSDRLLDIQVAFMAANGHYGNWSVTASVTSTADPVAPGTPVNMTTNLVGSTVTVTATAANDNTRALVFKRGTTAQSFAAASLISRREASGNQAVSVTDNPPSGTWKYWCGAENASGIPSTTPASVTQTV